MTSKYLAILLFILISTFASYVLGYLKGKEVNLDFEINKAKISESSKIIKIIKNTYGESSGAFEKEIYSSKTGRLIAVRFNGVLTIRSVE
jgi:hypothetical protein